MSDPAHDDLVEDIQHTREELAATVEELAHRLDVKAQVDEKVAETKEAVHAKVSDAKEKVVDVKDAVAAKATDVKKTVVAKAGDAKEAVVHKVADAKETVTAKVGHEKTGPVRAIPGQTAPAPEPAVTGTAARGIPVIPVKSTSGTSVPVPVPALRDRALTALTNRDVQVGAAVAALAAAFAAILLRRS